MVTSRALTADDLAAGVSAVHPGRPWAVTNQGRQLAVSHCDRLLIQADAPNRLHDWTDVAALYPSGRPMTGRLFSTRLTVVADDDLELGLEVARAVAWQSGGAVTLVPH